MTQSAEEVARGLTKAQRAYLCANYMEFAFLDSDNVLRHYPSNDDRVMRTLVHVKHVLEVSPDHTLRVSPFGLRVAALLKEE